MCFTCVCIIEKSSSLRKLPTMRVWRAFVRGLLPLRFMPPFLWAMSALPNVPTLPDVPAMSTVSSP